MAFPVALASLNTREAIADAVYRSTLVFDTADIALLESAMTEDVILDLDGRVAEGKDAIRAGVFGIVSKLDTTHFVTNMRIDIKEGDSAASVTANFLAQHYREGQGKQPDATR